MFKFHKVNVLFTGLAPGVYRVQHGELPERILVIDHEPGSNMTPPAIIANVSVTQANTVETTTPQLPTIAGVCSLITGASTTTSSGLVNNCSNFIKDGLCRILDFWFMYFIVSCSEGFNIV